MKGSSSSFSKSKGGGSLDPKAVNARLQNSKDISQKGKDIINKANDPHLKLSLAEIYRKGKVGDGSLAAAIYEQVTTGKKVGGVDHITKGKERIKNLSHLISKNKLNAKDKVIAKKEIRKIALALKGKKK